ncbi:hypothetical protein [Bacillus methanolicus]|uniref:ABM domain-containing protein n=1 Tax=Bacillus methanolicus (strain MGA3 / ATCC 53907) TaxID=796606 RepID=I3E3X5_BACMM|nr:hypothetical protein [Bacillus methanolicus]AIE58700.1 hypothetical protein BMMGA3_01050 [Bacillus methanolicus MGA3]EIJ81196.1 hypothetical protein MGA3_12940 [Bacillus methanolicus MGA3]UQD50801.1 hypothetical protein C0971_01110 [Bacillus methanolicus]
MFYARLVHYKLGTGQRQVAERLAKEFDTINRKLSGFRGNVYLFDDTAGEYRALNYWDTKTDAENAHKILFPKLENELKNFTKEEPTYKFFEVYDTSDDGGLLFSHIKI